MPRDSRGRFTAGNAGGPGRPSRRTEEEYLVALCEAVSLADWKRIVVKARDDAAEGDHQARSWLARYLIGDRPSEEADSEASEAATQRAEIAERRLTLIETYLRPLELADDRYPAEEIARVAAERLLQLDGARIVGNLKERTDHGETK